MKRDKPTKNRWQRMTHFVGEGTTASPATLSSPTYDFSYPGNSFTSRTSYCKWKHHDDTATATLRVLKSKYRQCFAYWISVTMTSATWQANLATIKIGNKEFVKPTHTHCIDATTTYDNTPFSYSGGVYESVPAHQVTVTCKFPDGSLVPNPVFELYASPHGLDRRNVGDAAGVVDIYKFGGTVYNNARRYYSALSGTYSTGDIITLATIQESFSESASIKDNIWPTTTFCAMGYDWIDTAKDWMPPIAITKTSSTDVTFDAHMAFLRLDHLRPASFITGGSFLNAIPQPTYPVGVIKRVSAVETGSDTLLLYFVRADLAAIPPGLYRKSSAYPGTLWSPVTGSDSTGYTAPTEYPSCPFVVKPGTI